MQPAITLASGSTTDPFFVQPDGWVIIEAGSASATLQYTTGTPADITNGTATWVTAGSYTGFTAIRADEELADTWVKLTAASGSITYHVEGELSKTDRLTIRGYKKTSINSVAPSYSLDSSGNVTGLVAPGGQQLNGSDIALPASTTSFVDGVTPWTRLMGPTEINALTKSVEISTNTAATYVTAASASGGPALFRREGAAVMVDGSKMTANFGNLNTTSAGTVNAAFNTGLPNTTISLLLYFHRLNSNSQIILRLGANTGNYVTYAWRADANVLVEGWNELIVSTAEPVGTSTNGQNAFQSSFSTSLGWQVGVGSYAFGTAIGYCAIEIQGVQPSAQNSSFVWVEGLYYAGKNKPRLTIGFDISNSAGLTLAKQSMDAYGFQGYAAVPTANGNPSAPAFLWSATDVATMKSLYAAGWDIIQHSVSHNSMGTLSDESMMISEFEGCRQQLKQLGCTRGVDLVALPNNSVSNRVVSAAKKAGIKWMRGTGPILLDSGLAGLTNPLLQGCVGASLGGAANDAALLVRLQAFIDLMILYGASGHIYTHAIQAGASDSINTNQTTFNSFLSYVSSKVAAGLLEVVTPSQFLNKSGGMSPTTLVTPNRLPIALGTSPHDVFNTGYNPVNYVVSGGTVSSITYSRDGSTFDATGQTAGSFMVNPGDRLRITYTVAPTVIQYEV